MRAVWNYGGGSAGVEKALTRFSLGSGNKRGGRRLQFNGGPTSSWWLILRNLGDMSPKPCWLSHEQNNHLLSRPYDLREDGFVLKSVWNQD